MKSATINELKKELQTRSEKELVELTTRLAKFKKENKELLTYLLFSIDDEQSYVNEVKEEISASFDSIPSGHSLYLKMKMIRKTLRITKRHIRYTGSDKAEVQLLIHFCSMIKDSGWLRYQSTALNNLYDNLIRKIEKTIEGLHEDLQFDYRHDLESLVEH